MVLFIVKKIKNSRQTLTFIFGAMTILQLYDYFIESHQNITTDSRKITPNCLFFALRGETFNGNVFAQKAIEMQACWVIMDDSNYFIDDKTCILVDNVLETLQQLANYHRNQLKNTTIFIGITGSNGKTTSKELLKCVLSTKFATQATIGNLNNHIGVPLTLLSVYAHHQFAVIEMGANHPDEVLELCQIVEPDVALVTSIGKEHLEGFGSMEQIIKAETDIYRFVAERKGLIFVNADDAILMHETQHIKNKMLYGVDKNADTVGRLVASSLFVHFRWDTTYRLMLHAPTVETQLIGVYNFCNLMSAASIGRYFSVPYDKINEALSSYLPSNKRSEYLEKGSNRLIIDCYNANPSSMHAAIHNFAHHIVADYKVLIVGDMFELGHYAGQEHRAMIDDIEGLGFDEVYCIGANFMGQSIESERIRFFESVADLKKYKPLSDFEHSFVLIKGSRGMALEDYLLD